MKTTTVQCSQATGIVLDWLVAKCEGDWILRVSSFLPNHSLGRMNFSTKWDQAGPIIEENGMAIAESMPGLWLAMRRQPFTEIYWEGPTPLIAAMRCYVASKLGDVVEVPEELV